MGTEGIEQRQRGDEEEEDDEELFDSDSLLSNSDDDRDHEVETNQNGPLFELSTLVEQLPIKIRGLSKYYQGKSQSFTSLSVVRSLEDLPKKKQSPYIKRKTMMKTCDDSYGGGGRVMSRKAPRAASCAALAAQGGSGGRKPPLVPDLQKNSWNSH